MFEGVAKKFFCNLAVVVRDPPKHLCNPIQLGIGFGKLRISFSELYISFSELFIYFFLGSDQFGQELPNFFFGHFLCSV